MPDWWVIGVAIATPLLGFAGRCTGPDGYKLPLSTTRDGVWRRREETMRLLWWAAELTMRPDAAGLGLRVLDSLSRSEMLQPADEPLIDAVLEAVTEPVEAIHTEDETQGGGTDERTGD